MKFWLLMRHKNALLVVNEQKGLSVFFCNDSHQCGTQPIKMFGHQKWEKGSIFLT